MPDWPLAFPEIGGTTANGNANADLELLTHSFHTG
jgi:hypothetical protein